jgi:hypothetical protein
VGSIFGTAEKDFSGSFRFDGERLGAGEPFSDGCEGGGKKSKASRHSSYE